MYGGLFRIGGVWFEVPAELFSGNPNIIRVFRFNLTFTEAFFWKPNFFRVLIKNRTLLGHGSYIPNIITVLREIHILAANHINRTMRSQHCGHDRACST